jgi:hypothetical protein
MAVRKPLVVNTGQVEQLQAGDVISGVPSGQVTVDFTATPTDMATAVVTGQDWVGFSSLIVAMVADSSSDHLSGEDQLLEQLHVTVTDLVLSTGFTIRVHAPNKTTGQYKINWIGTP